MIGDDNVEGRVDFQLYKNSHTANTLTSYKVDNLKKNRSLPFIYIWLDSSWVLNIFYETMAVFVRSYGWIDV